MRIALISTYDLGRQPFGLASPAAWLRERGHEVTCVDLSQQQMPGARFDLIAFHLPMHTATRLAVKAIQRLLASDPRAAICCYGLYAPLNESYLRELGVRWVFGGEFEPALVELAESGKQAASIALDRLQFRVPDRSSLPGIAQYAPLRLGTEVRTAGYTEASRGCKHLCRHCPIVPVYRGTFRVVQPEIVLADVRQQVEAGAAHITFGDPDFLNGPGHARKIVEALHREWPSLTYDVTIKVEHLLRHPGFIPHLKETGCLWVTSAVESMDDEVLRKLDKGHTREDFVRVVKQFRDCGLTLSPTFIPFTPWTTLQGYRELLQALYELHLVDEVSPVQLALRLLIPAGSLLLELPDVQAVITEFDAPTLLYRWTHPEEQVETLSREAMRIAGRKASRRESFASFWQAANCGPLAPDFHLQARATIPYLDEPWYC